MLLLRYDFSLRCDEPCEWICPICKAPTEPPIRNEARCRACGMVTPKAKCSRCREDVLDTNGERKCRSELNPSVRSRVLFNPYSVRDTEALWSFKTNHDDMLQIRSQLDRCKRFISYELLDREGVPKPEVKNDGSDTAPIAWSIAVLLTIACGTLGNFLWESQKELRAATANASGEMKQLSALSASLTTSNENLQLAFATQNAELSRLRQEADTAKTALTSREASLSHLDAELALAKKLALQNQLSCDACAEKVKSLNAQLAALEGAEKHGAPADRFENSEAFARQALLGLQAKPLHRVVFLCDASSGMRAGPRWQQATNLLANWAKHLGINECSLVAFSDTVSVFPAQGMLSLRDPATQAIRPENQKALVEHLSQCPAGAFADTLSGLLRAYQYTNADAIVLFTDAHPKTDGASQRRMRDAIVELVRAHPHPPINVVALGDYEVLASEDKAAGKNLELAFLRELATLSTGAFMAR